MTEKLKDTRLEIARALNSLLKEKPLNRISVVDVCHRAGFSRTTFYRYFPDIYGVEDWLWDYACRDILEGIGENYGWTEGHRRVFEFMLENREYYIHTENDRKENSFLLTASDRSKAGQIYTGKIESRLGRKLLQEERTQLQYISYMYASMTHKWIREGMTTPIQLLEALVSGLVPDFISETLGN